MAEKTARERLSPEGQRGPRPPKRLGYAACVFVFLSAIVVLSAKSALAAETLYYLGSLGQGSTGQPDFTGVTLPGVAPTAK